MSNKPGTRFVRYLMTGTGLGVLALMGVGSSAIAQETAPVAAKGDETTEVVVVGVRASQQSAINRKKKAKTAVDSIVADDVGSFPDRNVNEALSRIPGMGLQRGETGEGESFSLRGNSADLTRVELDGMSTAPNGFALAQNPDASRGSDLRNLPADLIQSIDVVKGNTADMTEGGLGGSVQIKTRSALDFKKPYFSMRVAGERNSLSEKWAPDFNIVASRKFFDNRLGVIFNLSSRKYLGDSHQVANAGGNNWGGYIRQIDWDNSPEKTFSYNPSVVGGVDQNGIAYNAPMLSFNTTNGGKFNTNSALDIVTKSANAKTKAECMAAFPLYTAAELGTIVASTNNADQSNAQQQRIREQVSCLNQWNDYSPNQVRETFLFAYEDRLTWDVRFDFRVNDKMTVWLKYQEIERNMKENRSNRNQGGIAFLTAASNGLSTLALTNNTNIAVGTPNTISPVAGSGYYLYNAGYPTAALGLDSTQGGSNVQNGFAVTGIAVNVNPATVKVDKNHHVTEVVLDNTSYYMDHIRNDEIRDESTVQLGGTYKDGPLTIDFTAGRLESYYSRYEMRAGPTSSRVTGAKLYVLEDGNWAFDYPSTFNVNDVNNYMPYNALTGTAAANAAAALYTNAIRLDWNPKIVEYQEDQGKFDITYRTPDLPFFKSFKTGASYRKRLNSKWEGAGYSPKAGVYVPTKQLRASIRACDNQATTTAVNACVYGYVPNAMTTTNFNHGTQTVTRAELVALMGNSILYNEGTFMPDYGAFGGMQLWNSFDLDKLKSGIATTERFNFDCMKTCTASDGNVYQMPSINTSEEVTAAYYMVDFEQSLPWGMEFGGNFGVRVVNTKVAGNGFVSVNSIRKNITGVPTTEWNPNEGYNRTTTTTINKPVAIEREYTDWMPSYNFALWPLADKLVLRYNWSKTMAPPRIDRLVPAGTCTIDQRIEDRFNAGETELDMGCTGFGNPALLPYQASKNNTSIEWYPGKDTSVSLAYYRQKVKVGKEIGLTLADQPLFAGTDEVDPATGRKLADFTFNFGTYINGPGETQSGWEFSVKTAFTSLPWKLRYTGADFNYSTNKSSSGGWIDPVSGENLGAAGRPDYFANLAFWYDDGKTNARITYQKKAQVFDCVSSCGRSDGGVYSFPINNPTRVVNMPYNPGEPFYYEENAYVDAKISHKLQPNIEIYWEGRNLLRQANSRIGSERTGFETISRTPWFEQYGGRRFTVGLIYKLQ
ncbi:TonB-dependent receptor [Asticcacaulis sp. BYS171W]|uniref:TonB-dependent receptor n=1 Tax=Asticcacaulis aquaticus TaxID=2984212 RepID=A0ABT5HWS4_9CAUL|nr:TonB-dependent receptor [Asticcacaulis aquaticus]MDC7684541.1 TonB-dependent receptor [Asticcacaulis aquaticus]